ncbi:MAG: hypothetical protein PVF68_03400 [Acidobacteriota bacterium]|jgi:hypothetical protein
MITGFNTDIKFNGKTYHVQTEDRGSGNPILESLVYVKGQILDAVQTPYGDRFPGGVDESVLAGMLEAQHKRVLRSIKNGRYDPEGIKPFGHGIISDRPLDEVILDFIREQQERETTEVQVEELGDLAPGWTGALQVTLRTDILKRPVRDCLVRILVDRPEGRPPLRLFEGVTDARGQVLAEITLPDHPAHGEVRIVAEKGAAPAEAVLPFPRPAPRSGS